MSNLNAIQRLLGAAAAVAVCACALPAAAQQAQQVQQEAQEQAAPAADAQTIARDPVTGKLRAATPEEQAALAALRSAARARIAPAPLIRKFHPSGASGIELNDESMMSVTAVRTPDGKVQTICNEVHDGQSAAHVHAATNTPVTE
jgi:hypothetical protein